MDVVPLSQGIIFCLTHMLSDKQVITSPSSVSDLHTINIAPRKYVCLCVHMSVCFEGWKMAHVLFMRNKQEHKLA